MPGITITVEALTQQAAANLSAFVNGTESGLKRLESATLATGTANKTLQVNGLAAQKALQSLRITATALGSQAFPQLTSSLMLLQSGIGVVRSGSAALQSSFGGIALAGPMAAAAIAAVVAVAWTGVEAWKAYKAKQDEALTASNLDNQAFAQKDRLKKLIETNAVNLRPGEGKELVGALDAATSKDMPNVVAWVRWKLQGRIATEAQLKANEELMDLNRKAFIETLEGFDKERQAALEDNRLQREEINAKEKAAGMAADGASMQVVRTNIQIALDKKLLEIETRRVAELTKAEEALTKAEEERASKLHQFALRRLQEIEAEIAAKEELRQKDIQAIEGNFRLTPGQKRDAIQPLLTPEENKTQGADARSWSDEWAGALATVNAGFENLAQNITGGFVETLQSAMQSMAALTADVILGTKSMAQGWREIGTTAVRSIITMVSQYLAAQLAMEAVETVLHIKRVARSRTEGAASAAAGVGKAGEQGGWVGVLIYAVAYAAVMAGVSALASSIGGREQGGPVSAGTPYIVGEKRAELFVPAQSGYIVPKVPQAMASRYGGTSGGEAPAGGATHVVNFFDYADVKRYMESHVGEKIVMNHINNRRGDLGMNT